MCDFVFSQKLHTKELRLSNISESLLYGSSVLIFYSSLLSLSDELHTFWDYEPDTGNSYLLTRSDDDLIMDIFVIME